MECVTIYLRSIEQDGKKRLSLFDSNRNCGIDDLITEVSQGTKIIWALDCCSGIKSIAKIYSKTGKRNVFCVDPSKAILSKNMRIKLGSDVEGEEAYGIDYVLTDGTKLSVDPVIRIKPPQ